ncbi:hypothetical protein F7725_010967 [Dissostichus mawsoni]|uniref:Uncharacterized protein n=1 Tax=Dissostichus mawsoni TaxID=36200 RepID=A0A7J5Z7X7_DISMA|nr:hypothetical protein F7725_010967 [Dissostichus mawsoni]
MGMEESDTVKHIFGLTCEASLQCLETFTGFLLSCELYFNTVNGPKTFVGDHTQAAAVAERRAAHHGAEVHSRAGRGVEVKHEPYDPQEKTRTSVGGAHNNGGTKVFPARASSDLGFLQVS